MKFSKILISGLAIAAVTGGGCKKFLDTNQNPNVATNVTPDLLLPSIEVTLGNASAVNFGTYGGIWGQFWTQNPNSSQYRQIERYQPTAPDFDNGWSNMYAGAGTDLMKMETIATANNQTQYEAIAKLLRAYTFQMITDAWGDVPYTQALKGQQEDGGVASPKYDAQRDIYTSIIALVDQGLALIDLNTDHPGSDDLIYGGDMSKWQRFGNTLKLRMYMRLSQIDPGTASAGIAAMAGATYLGAGDDAQISYSSAAGNQNPLYNEAVGLQRTQNLVASSTVLDSMKSNNDPRIPVFFDIDGNGDYGSIAQGDFTSSASQNDVSYPSYRVGGNVTDDNSAAAPVKLLTSYESLFLQSEATARGWLSGAGSAQDLFEQGIRVNFTDWGLASTDADTYIAGSYWGMYPAGGTTDAQVRHIVTQKWFSMCGNENFEAWTEWRRTGYPDFFVLSANAQIASFPVRFLYPDVEITRNANFPGTKNVTDKVYWDVQ